jgi:microcystin-dependent protein
MSSIFPADPEVNDEFQGYRFNGTAWKIIGVDLTADYPEITDGYISEDVIPITIATKTYADTAASTAVSNVIDSSPNTLDTLNELAAALGDDPNFATTITSLIAEKMSNVPGMISQYAGATSPNGWMICDGSAVSRTTYSALYSAIGNSYGSGDGSTTFNLPNLKGRVPVGRDSAQTEFDSLGENGGEKSVTLTASQMNHRHNFKFALNDNNYNATGSLAGMTQAGAFRYSDSSYSSAVLEGYITDTRIDGSSAVSGQSGRFASTGNTDTPTLVSPTAHNNLQPYIVVNYIIKF